MKLQFPFIELPLRFDSDALAAELAAVDESEWQPHPQGYTGNFALPLIAVNGDPDDDGFRGEMRATPMLARLPGLHQALGALGAVLGRTRLMRLSGHAEVEPHIDRAYYWAERTRVHIPIVTQPGVRFHCGDADIHMAAGECWIFDTWRKHRVVNAGAATRIHLVADTVGGDGFWELFARGRPHHVQASHWAPQSVPGHSDESSPLCLESANTPTVMSPWELHSHLMFLFGEMERSPLAAEVQQLAVKFARQWRAAWAQFGESPSGYGHYRRLLATFTETMSDYRGRLPLRNGLDFHNVLSIMILAVALADGAVSAPHGEPRGPELAEEPCRRKNPEFERPVFIVSPPRSGSTALFDLLARAANVATIGDESHVLIETIPGLHPAARGYESNRLDAAAASAQISAQLRERFRNALRLRDGTSPQSPVRMLEKTPKNALRVPFLAAVFPDAQFIYLYRDPREVIASMMEAWTSGRFRTYPKLPDWQGLAWSMVLTPGWRGLAGKPLHEIVAVQWRETMEILLNDLTALSRERVQVVHYEAFVADPNATAERLCAMLDLVWDRPLQGALPPSRYTTSAPAPDKWRRHQAQIEAVLPGLAATIARGQAWTAT